MELQTLRPSSLAGSVFSLMKHHVCKRKSCNQSGIDFTFLRHRRSGKHSALKRKYLTKSNGGSVSCSFIERNTQDVRLSDARVIYSVAPAMGHNQESHPESHFRVPAIVTALEEMELTSKFRGSEIIELQNFNPATVDDIASIHARAYVSGLEKAMDWASQRGIVVIEGSGPTYATATTFQESLIAAGAGIALIDSVVSTSKSSVDPPMGFALIRPPGHHAIPKGPMGFCVFGNVAIAARYAQRVHGLKRVFIIDFDVHHGNGTNDAFYDDADIFFLSTHQDGSYPGTGKIDEAGHGDGEGTTLNLPLPGGSGDVAMRTVFDEVIVPCAQRFKPDIILVSAGYDGHILDPLASLQFTTGTYYMLAANIKQLAKELCGGRCVFFLEGGYNLKSLSYSVADSFRAFLGESSVASKFDNPAILFEEPTAKVKQAIQRVKHIHSL
ncbi:histone deacetylase 14-like [Mangifera indica]|uniref:histone deacetylase 14-like n=1 Tax=Mangifera indica TaxID=29780 RepID=UPI001CFC2A20|nr:histone deacetylase 14-like [Mangifera indica]